MPTSGFKGTAKNSPGRYFVIRVEDLPQPRLLEMMALKKIIPVQKLLLEKKTVPFSLYCDGRHSNKTGKRNEQLSLGKIVIICCLCDLRPKRSN